MYVVTFDLENAANYPKAYQKLRGIGLFNVSPRRQKDLPSTTVMGVPDGCSGCDAVRRLVVDTLSGANISVSLVLVGELKSQGHYSLGA